MLALLVLPCSRVLTLFGLRAPLIARSRSPARTMAEERQLTASLEQTVERARPSSKTRSACCSACGGSGSRSRSSSIRSGCSTAFSRRSSTSRRPTARLVGLIDDDGKIRLVSATGISAAARGDDRADATGSAMGRVIRTGEALAYRQHPTPTSSAARSGRSTSASKDAFVGLADRADFASWRMHRRGVRGDDRPSVFLPPPISNASRRWAICSPVLSRTRSSSKRYARRKRAFEPCFAPRRTPCSPSFAVAEFAKPTMPCAS